MPNNMSLNPAQVASMDSSSRNDYIQSLPPQQRAQMNAAVASQISSDNKLFMRKSIEKIAYCPVAGGSGITANYAQGQTLVFDLPVVGGGYAKGLLINANIIFTPGTSNANANAAIPFSIFQELDLNYNGAQIRTHPIIIKCLDLSRGFAYPYLDGTLITTTASTAFTAPNVAAIQNNISAVSSAGAFTAGGPLPGTVFTAGTAYTLQARMFLPFNAIAPDSVPGVLPVMGVGNKPQLKLFCSSAFLGLDPLLSPISPTAATTTVAFGAATVNVDMVYLDGTNLSSPVPLQLDIESEPTLQYYWDTPLNPLNAGLLQRQHIATLLEHWYVYSVVIDSNQSTSFINSGSGALGANSNTLNITAMDLSPDSVGQISFVKYGANTNVSIFDFFQRNRRQHNADFDAGIIPWIVAPSRIVADSSNRNGLQALNMRPGGYPATTHAYQVTQVSQQGAIAGFSATTPRVETFLVSMNYDGLRLA